MTLQFGQIPPIPATERPDVYDGAKAEALRNGAVLAVLSRNGELKQSMQELQEQTRDLPAAALAASGQLPHADAISGVMPSHTAVIDPQDPAVRANFYGPNGNQVELAQVPALQAQSTAHYGSTTPVQIAMDAGRTHEYLQNNLTRDPALADALARHSGTLATLRRAG